VLAAGLLRADTTSVIAATDGIMAKKFDRGILFLPYEGRSLS
jgi:hypothetical protein